MKQYKIKFVVENQTEETVTSEYNVTVHQYMKIREQVRKLKGVR